MKQTQRRDFLLGGAAMAAAASVPVLAQAQAREVKVAIAVPLSGAWARNGELHLKGAQSGVDDINAAGGIKALGGAKMKLIVVDSGDSTEKAKNAAQRLLSQEPDLVGGTGAFVSSFTLAITEITERAEVPWLTLSYSDQITARGYKYVFQTSPIASKQSIDALPALMEIAKQSNSARPKTIGIVMDNTASPMAFTKPMREGEFAKLGLKLGRGRIPMLGNGGHMGAPELLQVVGKQQMEGVMAAMANWSGKGHEKLVADFKTRHKEPWMPQDSVSTYGDMWIFKEAMEKAASADPKKVAAAIRAMNESGGASKYFPGGKLAFDANGRRTNADLVIVQWQDGEPKTVFPSSFASAKAIWPKQ